ncbi:hypothetical protein [Streptacidiphilus sp. P02-A3a]|nr:hypothetical protein [Streptacidiphilus sp. P02-A3a]QMU71094.1 hypothetical protein GXP74_25595 [Streptacidiphilus sp. P02-A3a]
MTKTQEERDADTVLIGQIVLGAIVVGVLLLIGAVLVLHRIPGFPRH